jgi:hypothetical protein
MGVNTSWYDKFVCTVDDFGSFVGDAGRDLCNFSILDKYITMLRQIGINDSGIFEKVTLLESNVREKRFVEKFSH